METLFLLLKNYLDSSVVVKENPSEFLSETKRYVYSKLIDNVENISEGQIKLVDNYVSEFEKNFWRENDPTQTWEKPAVTKPNPILF